MEAIQPKWTPYRKHFPLHNVTFLYATDKDFNFNTFVNDPIAQYALV